LLSDLVLHRIARDQGNACLMEKQRSSESQDQQESDSSSIEISEEMDIVDVSTAVEQSAYVNSDTSAQQQMTWSQLEEMHRSTLCTSMDLVDAVALDRTTTIRKTTMPTIQIKNSGIPSKRNSKKNSKSKQTKSKKKSRKGNTFRLHAKKLFLTFPQCDLSKERCLENAEAYFENNIEWIVIAQESHQDGSPHLHVGVCLKNECDIRNAKSLDIVGTKHGDYRSMLKPMECLRYITKDKNYIQKGIDVVKFLQFTAKKQSGRLAQVAYMASEGKTVEDIDDIAEMKHLVMLHKRKIDEYITFQQVKKIKRTASTWTGIPIASINGVENVLIASWLNANLLKVCLFGTKHLYVYGDTSLGKTSLANCLEKLVRVYYVPYEDWYDDYQDGQYDLAIIDEFKGQKPITWLNKCISVMFLSVSSYCLYIILRQK